MNEIEALTQRVDVLSAQLEELENRNLLAEAVSSLDIGENTVLVLRVPADVPDAARIQIADNLNRALELRLGRRVAIMALPPGFELEAVTFAEGCPESVRVIEEDPNQLKLFEADEELPPEAGDELPDDVWTVSVEQDGEAVAVEITETTEGLVVLAAVGQNGDPVALTPESKAAAFRLAAAGMDESGR